MPYRTIQIKPSSNLLSIQFDEETKDLLGTFVRDGRQYIAHGVDARTAEGFSRAPSAGRYWNAFIRNQFMIEEI
jgi:hypothetical protein